MLKLLLLVPMEESTLAKDVPPLGLKEIYVTPKKSPSHVLSCSAFPNPG